MTFAMMLWQWERSTEPRSTFRLLLFNVLMQLTDKQINRFSRIVNGR